MRGDAQVLDVLNRALTIELTAINQYFCQARMCANWGFHKLAKKHYHESLGEMKHADQIIQRILFLEGAPEIARYDIIRVGTDVKEQLESDLKLEIGGVQHYNAAIDFCTAIASRSCSFSRPGSAHIGPGTEPGSFTAAHGVAAANRCSTSCQRSCPVPPDAS